MSDFNTAWKLFPHHATRSKKAPSRAIWQAIITAGYNCIGRVDSSPIRLGNVQETEEALIEAVKAMKMHTPEEELKFVPGFQVWLHQARFLDYDDEERKELAINFDTQLERIEKHKREGRLR